MKHVKLFLGIFILSLVILSCNKEGQTGELDVALFPVHNGVPVKGGNAYVRFGATDFPGTSPNDYDLSIPSDTSKDFILIESLRRGNYYIYCIAFDSLNSVLISGGTHIKLKGRSGYSEHTLELKE